MMEVGKRFESFDSLMEYTKIYEKQVFSKFFVRDCRTLENQVRKFPNNIAKQAPKELKYVHVKMCCIKGGKDFKSKNTARKTSTFRNGCQANFFVKLTVCGKYLKLFRKMRSITIHVQKTCSMLSHTKD